MTPAQMLSIAFAMVALLLTCQSLPEPEPHSKRAVALQTQQLQQLVSTAKRDCLKKLKMPLSYEQRRLMLATSPSQQEKCLLECILKSTKFMDSSNKLNTGAIGRLAGSVSNGNELVISIATATAEACNRRVHAANACEAASQINRCIGRELVAHKIRLYY